MKASVVDTNVLIVASGRNTHASLECQLACVQALARLQSRDILAIDALGLILDEYQKHLNFSGEPGTGGEFFRHIFDNQFSVGRIERVPVTAQGDAPDEFEEFPDDPRLRTFDRSDRKFVATALTSKYGPSILNATDSDWQEFSAPLAQHGVRVAQICPEHQSRGGDSR